MQRRTLVLVAALAVAAVVAILLVTALQPGGRAPTGSSSPSSTASTGGSRTPPPTVSATPTAPTQPAPTAEAAPPAEPPPPPPPPAPVCADSLLDCVNQARAAEGVGPVTTNGTLTAAAQACADRMAASGQLTHSGATPGFAAWGENIAQGYGSVPAVFDGWMNSPGHRANILNPAFTQLGVGYAAAGSWWCQQFGG